MKITMKRIIIGFVFCCVVNPMSVSIFVNEIGKSMGLKLLGESGIIYNMKTNNQLNDKASSIGFVRNLQNAGSLPWLMLGFPFSVPIAGVLVVKSSWNAIIYLLFYKIRVELGEFDDTSPRWSLRENT
jgi:hypothetical protein